MTDDPTQPPPFWIRILIKLESLQERLGHRLANTAEFLEWSGGYVLATISYFLFAPFRLIVRWLFGSGVVETTQRAQDQLAEGTTNLFVRCRDYLVDVLPKIFPPQLFWPFYWLFDRTLWFIDFFLAWYFTRRFRNLIGAIPAVLLSVPLLGALVLGSLYSPAQKIRHYENARREALSEQDQVRADFLLTRLQQLGFQDNDRAAFEQAMALVEEQKMDEALAMLSDLAPLDTPGFAQAHLYLAAALFEGRMVADKPWDMIRAHTNHALEQEPNHPLAKRFLVECQLQDKDYDAAVEGMEELRRTFPDFNAELAHQYAVRGEMVVAKRYANAAIQYMDEIQQEAEKHPEREQVQITPQGFLRMAEVHAIAGDPDRELQVLREGAERHRDSEANQQAYAERLMKELNDFSFAQQHQREQLKQLLITDPNHDRGLRMLFQPISAGDAAAELVASELLDDERTPAKLLKAIGDMHLATEQFEKAKGAYQKACDKDVQSAYAWNNLAWLWSNSEPIDMEMALRCTDLAMKAKRDANFFETRGQILVKLERWEEAAHYLERAINGLIPNPQQAHRSLATIYTALGKPEQAAAHQAASGQ